MPKQLFQRPAALKLGNPGKGGNSGNFGGQDNWNRKKNRPPKKTDEAAASKGDKSKDSE